MKFWGSENYLSSSIWKRSGWWWGAKLHVSKPASARWDLCSHRCLWVIWNVNKISPIAQTVNVRVSPVCEVPKFGVTTDVSPGLLAFCLITHPIGGSKRWDLEVAFKWELIPFSPPWCDCAEVRPPPILGESWWNGKWDHPKKQKGLILKVLIGQDGFWDQRSWSLFVLNSFPSQYH